MSAQKRASTLAQDRRTEGALDDPVWETFGPDALGVMLRWKMDLRERFGRRQLVMELADAYVDTADLEIEAEQFKRICHALSWGR